MKNLILSALLVLTVSFAFAANDVEKVSTFNVEKTLELVNSTEFADADFSMEIINSSEVVGTCHIRIYEDGELVYSANLPCNTASECKAMLRATISAL